MTSNPVLTPSQASGGDRLKIADLEGCLVILEPTGPPASVQTGYGQGEYTPARVAVVSGANELAGAWHDLWVFAKVLRTQLAAAARTGSPLVGEVTKGQAQAGQSPPWVLADPDADGVRQAVAVYNVLNGGTPAPAAPPAGKPDPWGRPDEAEMVERIKRELDRPRDIPNEPPF